MITEERSVSNFTGVDFSTFGEVVLIQGEGESLTIEGSDNLVPLVKTEVRAGVLHIDLEENINILNRNLNDYLIFTISVVDLNGLTLSGLGDVKMDSLSTSDLSIEMSGAGQFVLDELTAEELNINLSGLGNIDVSGTADHSEIEISGAGQVDAGDLESNTAEVKIPGLGSATVWVTESLTGDISGGGSVEYYGDPSTDLETSGLGSFNSLGDK
jgi:hypothetical protein